MPSHLRFFPPSLFSRCFSFLGPSKENFNNVPDLELNPIRSKIVRAFFDNRWAPSLSQPVADDFGLRGVFYLCTLLSCSCAKNGPLSHWVEEGTSLGRSYEHSLGVRQLWVVDLGQLTQSLWACVLVSYGCVTNYLNT